ncbi:MAG: hypothetical protein ACRDD0_03270 [Bacteroidales bacterium]
MLSKEKKKKDISNPNPFKDESDTLRIHISKRENSNTEWIRISNDGKLVFSNIYIAYIENGNEMISYKLVKRN